MSFTGFFFGRNRKNNNSRSTSCGKLRCNSVRTRNLAMEPLETRDLLSVTTGAIDNAEYAEIRASYPDFNLPELQANLNVMTITPDNGALSLADLKSAIADAGTTQKPDLILVRTSETANSVTYASNTDEISININASRYGSVTIIGWGEENFTLDANQQCRVMSVSGYSTIVNLGGLTIQNGKTSASGGGIYNYDGTLTVTSSTISGNTADSGGGIYIDRGTLAVTNSTIAGNTASSSIYGGGGIYNHDGTLTVTNSTISGNTASSNGGGIYNRETLTITNSTISGNTAPFGGGISIGGTATVTNSIVSRNYNDNILGNLSLNSSNNLIGYDPRFVCPPQFNSNGKLTNAKTMDLHLRSDSIAIDKGDNAAVVDIDSDVDGNTRRFGETVDIGAYEYQGDRNDEPIPYSTVVNTLNDSFDLNDNELSLREAIYYAPEYVTITFADNLEGKIVLSLGQLKIESALAIDGDNRITIDGNQKSRVFYVLAGTDETPVVLNRLAIQNGRTSDSGGGIFNNYGTLTVTNTTISENTVYGYSYSYGGGIYNSSGTLTVTNSEISRNTASSGGGIYNYFGTTTVTNSTISRNNASSFSSSCGGGIYNYSYNGTATLTITNSTIADNSATWCGGGIVNSGILTVTNSTIVKNKANGYSNSFGGGIYNDISNASLTITNSTIAGNTARCQGGGIYNNYSNVIGKFYNSIVACNTATYDSDIYFVQSASLYGYNSLSSYSEWEDGTDNIEYDNSLPLFTDATNGNYQLEVASQAINKGNNQYAVDSNGLPLTVDLANSPRIQGESVDIGAYEFDMRNVLAVPKFTLSVDGATVIVTISEVENASSYTVLYQIDGADGWRTITNIQGASATFVGNVGTRYNVKVQANGNEYYTDSNYSAVQRITIADDLSAQNDFVKTTMNSPVVIDYRANDEATDWSVVTVQFGEASHGEYVVNNDGTITYTPDNGFFGMDTVSYTIISPSGKTSLGSISISVESSSVVPLNVPANFALSAEETTVTASWSRVNNASSYTVMYQIDETDNWTTITDIPGTTTSFVGVAGATYNVKVKANATGNYIDSEFSESSSITLDVPSTQLIGMTLSTSSPLVGSTITATLNPAGATATYQWYSGETPINGATESIFTVTEAQIGQPIVCIATGTNNYQGSVFAITDVVYGYNANDYQKALAFLEQTDANGIKNGAKLNANYDPNNPTTWTGVNWTTIGNEKRISALSINNRTLVGDADFSNMVSLTTLNCYSNQLTSLDVSACTALQTLNCYSNQLTSLDVSNHTELRILNCDHNQLTSLDVSGCIKLNYSSGSGRGSGRGRGSTGSTAFSVINNPLVSINLSGCIALTSFSYVGTASSNTVLETLDASGCTSLQTLNCSYGQLTSLDVSGCNALKTLSCSSNQLTTLDVTNNTALNQLYCDSNQLSTLDVSNNTALTTLNCSSNQLVELDVLANTQLTSLNIGNIPGLETVFISKKVINKNNIYLGGDWTIQTYSGATATIYNNYTPTEAPFTATNASGTQTIEFISIATPTIESLTVEQYLITASWSAVENALHYTLEYQIDGIDSWTPIANIEGVSTSFIGYPGKTYNVRVKACSANDYFDSYYSPIQTIAIADVNQSAQNDFVKTTLNTPAVIDYRANDEATDWTVVTVQFGKASHGEYTVNEDGTIIYTPEEGFYGTDIIGYGLVSPSGKIEIASISVAVGLPIATSVQKTSGAHTPSTAMAASVDSLTEWDSCYIELWAQGVNELSAGETTITMSYNPAVFCAPTFAACADGAVLSVSQGVELPDGSVQVELTVSTTQALSSQTDNLFLGTVVLTPSMEEGAGIADPLVSESICTLDGVNLTTTVETMSYDLTHSGNVGVEDFVAFATVFGLKPGNMSPEHPLYALAVKADFNKDGVVNSDDFIIFSINFGASKSASVKPVAQPGAASELRSASNELREDELNSECEIRNAELIDSQVEFSESELGAPSAQLESPVLLQLAAHNSQLETEAYSAALLDLYDNQDRADLIGFCDVLAESRMDAPIFGVDGGSSQKTSSNAIDAVLQEDLLTIDWKE